MRPRTRPRAEKIAASTKGSSDSSITSCSASRNVCPACDTSSLQYRRCGVVDLCFEQREGCDIFQSVAHGFPACARHRQFAGIHEGVFVVDAFAGEPSGPPPAVGPKPIPLRPKYLPARRWPGCNSM